MTLRLTILGCGSSGGVPRLGEQWGACDPSEPKNRRMRCSLLVERVGDEGITRVLIDSSPDIRSQLLAANIGDLDAVLYTHAHADHVHGIDDLRMIVINRRAMLDVYADPDTAAILQRRFDYVFETPPGSDYPPILAMHHITGRVEIAGAGGVLTFDPLVVNHGRTDALGFRMDGAAYIPDVFDIGAESWAGLQGLDLLIIDALRREPHPSHTHLDKTLGWIEQLAPKHAVLTNMHNDLDYATLQAETPAHIEPAYDGMVLAL